MPMQQGDFEAVAAALGLLHTPTSAVVRTPKCLSLFLLGRDIVAQARMTEMSDSWLLPF